MPATPRQPLGAEASSLRILDHHHLGQRGRRESRRERLPDDAVAVKIDLPVVVIVSVGTHGKHRPHQGEFEDLHIDGRRCQHVRHRRPAARLQRSLPPCVQLPRMGLTERQN